jgi:hypothetical protein
MNSLWIIKEELGWPSPAKTLTTPNGKKSAQEWNFYQGDYIGLDKN